VNQDNEFLEILLTKGPLKAPDELSIRIQSAIAEKSHLKMRMWYLSAAAMAACIIISMLFFFKSPSRIENNIMQNYVFINNVFSTFTSADVAADSSYPILAMENSDLNVLFGAEDNNTETTLVDF